MRKIALWALLGLFVLACTNDSSSIPEERVAGTLRNLMQYQQNGNYAFDCNVTGFSPTTYEWNFGDGITRVTTHKGVAHTYNNSGTYFVTCTASNKEVNITTNTTVTVTLATAIPREDVEALSDAYPYNSYINTSNASAFDFGLFDDLDTYERNVTRPEYDFEEYDWEYEDYEGFDWEDEDTMPRLNTTTTDTGRGTASGSNTTNRTMNSTAVNVTIPINVTLPVNTTPTQENTGTPDNDSGIPDDLDDFDDIFGDEDDDEEKDKKHGKDRKEDDDEEGDQENGEGGADGSGDSGSNEDDAGVDEEEQENSDREDSEQRDEASVEIKLGDNDDGEKRKKGKRDKD